MTNKEKVNQFFTRFPGHLKTATSKIARRLDVDFKDVAEVRKQFLHTGTEGTLSEFLNKHQIDEKDVVNVYYKEKKDGIKFTVQTRGEAEEFSKESLRDFLLSYSYERVPEVELPEDQDGVAVINLMDAHIDKVSLVGEGGIEELELNIEQLFHTFQLVADDLFSQNVHTIIFPIGNDFFNTNGSFPATKKGTYQPTTVRWQDSFQYGVYFYRKCIDYLASRCLVHVVNIPGNHDEDKIFYLGEVLAAVYEDHPNVTHNMSEDPRKYLFSNNVLFGFGHGKAEKRKVKNLSSVMAIEKPYEWSLAKHRVWILGDIHHMQEYQTLSSLESFGVDIYFLRSTSSTDEWHNKELWVGGKKSISSILFNQGSIKRNEVFIP
jgi:hypothetical protein